MVQRVDFNGVSSLDRSIFGDPYSGSVDKGDPEARFDPNGIKFSGNSLDLEAQGATHGAGVCDCGAERWVITYGYWQVTFWIGKGDGGAAILLWPDKGGWNSELDMDEVTASLRNNGVATFHQVGNTHNTPVQIPFDAVDFSQKHTVGISKSKKGIQLFLDGKKWGPFITRIDVNPDQPMHPALQQNPGGANSVPAPQHPGSKTALHVASFSVVKYASPASMPVFSVIPGSTPSSTPRFSNKHAYYAGKGSDTLTNGAGVEIINKNLVPTTDGITHNRDLVIVAVPPNSPGAVPSRQGFDPVHDGPNPLSDLARAYRDGVPISELANGTRWYMLMDKKTGLPASGFFMVTPNSDFTKVTITPEQVSNPNVSTETFNVSTGAVLAH